MQCLHDCIPTPLGGVRSRPASQSDRSQCDYKISVRTGPTSDAGTFARVYVTLKGSRGEVKRRRLTRGGRRDFNFIPSSLERFRVHGKNVGELKQITSRSSSKMNEAVITIHFC